MEKAENFYWKLFKSTFIISAFTVGGGFVIIPLLKAKYVDEYKWIKEKDALDLVAIAQSMPGVVAINSAVILGYKMRGVKGTLTALLATVLPPLFNLYFLQFICYKSICEFAIKRYAMWCYSIDYQCSLRFVEKRNKEKIYIILIYYLFYLWYELFYRYKCNVFNRY